MSATAEGRSLELYFVGPEQSGFRGPALDFRLLRKYPVTQVNSSDLQ